MSLEGIAHLLGFSRKTLDRRRAADPELDADLMRALARFEADLLQTFAVNVQAAPTVPCATAAKAMLAQRFPHRHGADPRFRLSAQQAQEGYAEDLADPELNPDKATAGTVIGRLVEELLKRDEEG
jgi:hypothetical protein